MNKVTEQQIEEKLKLLANIEPSDDSRQQMNKQVRRIISGVHAHPSTARGFFYYAVASAAIIMIGIGLLWQVNTIVSPPTSAWQMPSEPTPTLGKLNSVFQSGGQYALNEYFDKIESNRQPRAEATTLRKIATEL